MAILRKAAPPRIDPSSPWIDDLFERETEGQVLANLIASSAESPLVISLQSPWGSGKTVFLQRLALHMAGTMRIPTVTIDAWKTDDCADPLVAIVAQLTRQLEAFRVQEPKLSRVVDRCISGLASHGSRIILPGSSILADLTVPGSGSVLRAAGQFAEKLLDAQKHRADAEKSFRKTLLDVRDLLTGRDPGRRPRPILIIIDELDRCRPDHAIRTLERIKHYFDAPGISFLIATDRGNLPAAVQSVYGAHVDGELYLRKFFDYEFHLRAPQPKVFAKNLVQNYLLPEVEPILMQELRPTRSAEMDSMLGLIRDPAKTRPLLKGEYLDAFQEFSESLQLTLRDQEQAMTMISAFVHSRAEDQEPIPVIDCFLACLRYAHPPSFRALVEGGTRIPLIESTSDVDVQFTKRLRALPHWEAIEVAINQTRLPGPPRTTEEGPTVLSDKLLRLYLSTSRSRLTRTPLLILAARLYARDFYFFSYARAFLRLGIT
ncbi:MAG: hypothetical protein KH046_01595 [Stenotrophomonas maltophilia]|uniref:KAP family P-loop NTPase fold protein n=1 Tax=Stenotrophomonas TaxID=40323 RepID=UPI0013DCDCE5|nr:MULTISPECIES: P-loop NTPase fold protein [Stenotrophomonas]MBS4799515.1 hypothetical protein [Stenotrophomonas maltophilia]MDG9987996.1 KAP family NTPase [Stenotrophomonas sp. GD04024]